MIITQKIPHQLCSCCAAFVRQADCLRKTKEELLPNGWEYRREGSPGGGYYKTYGPVVNIHLTYPTMHYIMDSGNRSCHLCSLLMTTIEEFAKVASRQALDRPIYTSLTLSAEHDTFAALAVFCLRLHREYPDSRVAGSHDHTKVACFIKRLRNDLMVGCDDCDNCINPHIANPKVPEIWRSLSPNWLHARWTDHTASDLSFEMAASWLDQCVKTHPECGIKFAHQPPTRVLDIHSLQHERSIRLVPGTHLGHARYATLSYRWGGHQRLMLRKENILSFQEGIPLSLLPKTLLEAVYVCRNLGINYLWVDALCIVQGEDGDCADEIPRMDSVYAGSILTIAVADAEHSDQGFLCFRSPLRQQPCRLDSDDFTTLLVEKFNKNRWCDVSQNVPGLTALDHRGWVLQERLLSPRTIYYGSYGLHWECRRGTICENNPSFETASSYPFGHVDADNIKTLDLTLQDDHYLGFNKVPNRTTALNLWDKIVSKYSRTDLTYQEDRLAALAGVARYFQPRLGVQASFGLWLEDFLEELIWMADEYSEWGLPAERIANKTRHLDLAPSWSWACLHNVCVTNAIFRDRIRGMPVVSEATIISLPPPTEFERLRPISQRLQSMTFAVKIKGQLRRCKWKDIKNNEIIPYEAEEIKDSHRGFAHADVPISDNEMELYCIKLARFSVHSGEGSVLHDYGMMLTPAEHNRSQYRRVGLYIEPVFRDVGLEHMMFPEHVTCSVVEVI